MIAILVPMGLTLALAGIVALDGILVTRARNKAFWAHSEKVRAIR